VSRPCRVTVEGPSAWPGHRGSISGHGGVHASVSVTCVAAFVIENFSVAATGWRFRACGWIFLPHQNARRAVAGKFLGESSVGFGLESLCSSGGGIRGNSGPESGFAKIAICFHGLISASANAWPSRSVRVALLRCEAIRGAQAVSTVGRSVINLALQFIGETWRSTRPLVGENLQRPAMPPGGYVVSMMVFAPRGRSGTKGARRIVIVLVSRCVRMRVNRIDQLRGRGAFAVARIAELT